MENSESGIFGFVCARLPGGRVQMHPGLRPLSLFGGPLFLQISSVSLRGAREDRINLRLGLLVHGKSAIPLAQPDKMDHLLIQYTYCQPLCSFLFSYIFLRFFAALAIFSHFPLSSYSLSESDTLLYYLQRILSTRLAVIWLYEPWANVSCLFFHWNWSGYREGIIEGQFNSVLNNKFSIIVDFAWIHSSWSHNV